MTNTKPVTDAAERLLADTYTLYLKTQNYHWNVTGPMFNTLHTLFETQYAELALAADEIAERIRALGAYAPGSYAAFGRLTVIGEAEPDTRAGDMIRKLAEDQTLLAKSAKALIAAGTAAGDDVSVDLGVRRMQVHEKNAWMLRSHLEREA
jgi:starvation-inducible DNA-binding protein